MNSAEGNKLPPAPAFAMGYRGGSRPTATMGQRAPNSTSASNEIDLHLLAQHSGSDADGEEGSERGVKRSPVASKPKSRLDEKCEASQVLEFLYLGSINDAHDLDFLAKNKITTIVNVSTEKYWGVTPDAVVHSFPIPDTSNFAIETIFKETFEIVDWVRKQWFAKRQHRMLIHCQKGKSRSATVVLAYLMKHNGWSLSEALEYVRARRPVIEPNLGFMEALRRLQESMRMEVRTVLRKRCTMTIRNVRRDIGKDEVRQFFEKRGGFVQNVNFFAKRVQGEICAEVSPSEKEKAQSSPTSGEPGDFSSGTASRALSTASLQSQDRPALYMVFFACNEHIRQFAKVLHSKKVDELSEPDGDALQIIVHGMKSAKRRTPKTTEPAAVSPAEDVGDDASSASHSDVEAPAADD